MRRTRIESFKTWRGGFTYLIIRKGLLILCPYTFIRRFLYMTQDEKHAVALMRYGAIAPLISGTKDDFQGLDDYYRAATEKPYRLRTAPAP